MTQQEALDILKLGHNVYLTGSAGSGKTYVLNEYIDYLRTHDIGVGVTASTGVAATHINGITINSWSGLGIRTALDDNDIKELLKRRYLRKRFSTTQVLVIDEISMMPSYMLDMIDRICQAFKDSDEPFGGMQVVLCGDFFQLPPVNRSSSTYNFVYKSKSWESLDIRVCYLEKEYRQEDKQFLHILSEIRRNNISKPSIKVLAARMYRRVSNITTRLYTHNSDVDAINEEELSKLPGHLHEYLMDGKGTEYLVDIMKKSCLAPAHLKLKVGAVVMFVKNNFEKGYVNGTLGTVADFNKKGYPLVLTSNGEYVEVSSSDWTIEEDGEVKARISQLPLRLAWAITIHKSQGMTLDGAEIDLGKPFVPGMGYVALSRVRSLQGISLKGLSHKALVVNDEIVEYDKQLRVMSEQTQKELSSQQWYEIEVRHMLFIEDLKQQDRAQAFYSRISY